MKRIVMSLGTLVFVAAVVAGGTGAFFSDTETSAGNVFTAGSVTLEVTDIIHTYNNDPGNAPIFSENNDGVSFELADLKPLDEGSIDYQVQNGQNDAYVCAMVTEVGNNDNGRNDPERDAGDTDGGAGNGELQDFLSFQFGAFSGKLSDISGLWQEVGVVNANTPTNSVIEYCFGDFDGGNCVLSGDDDNLAQTDSVVADISFYAEQTRNNPDFSCDDLNPEPEPEINEGQAVVTAAGGARWKGEHGGGEIYLGVPDLGVGANRNEAEGSWPVDGTSAASFSWDAAENELTTDVDGTVVTYDFDTEPVGPGCAVGDWDVLDIMLKDNLDLVDPKVDFDNIELNGFALGDLTHDAGGASRFQYWNITGIDFSADFVLTGDLVIDGDWNNNEGTVVEAIVGCTS